ncbi:MAG: hypothetical protein LBE21_01215 [Pseudomonadales bacterium]|jgi:outer membrane lipopolysaccharide assembly protein LptE/RlpB|nr:hypothetical protein [Pseudomonadales bacterium]
MKKALTLLAFGILAACGGAESQNTAIAAAAPDAAAYSEFNTQATIRDVMNALIDINADLLWNSVRAEANETGYHEYQPETDEEWLALRYAAVSIIEGGNALMIPGRRVAPPGSTTEFPLYEYLPDEVQAKLDEDRIAWDGFAQGLQAAAVQLLDAVNNRDVEKLSEYGALLDEACESCHLNYWYRPE